MIIRPLDREQLTAVGAANVSYDLRVGLHYRDHRDRNPSELPEQGEIKLSPGSAVIIESRETIRFPATRYGIIVPRVSLLQQGLSNTMSKVDPGYHGKLLITVFNLGRKPVIIKRDDRFCSLTIFSVGEGSRPYIGDPKHLRGDPGGSWGRRVRYWIDRNAGILAIISMILGAIATLFGSIK